jgi:hypothetical protein
MGSSRGRPDGGQDQNARGAGRSLRVSLLNAASARREAAGRHRLGPPSPVRGRAAHHFLGSARSIIDIRLVAAIVHIQKQSREALEFQRKAEHRE